MKNENSRLDGFIPRKPGDQLGSAKHNSPKKNDLGKRTIKILHSNGDDNSRDIGKNQLGYGIGRSDIDDSLRDLEKIDTGSTKKLSRKQRRLMAKKIKRPRSIVRRVIVFIIWLIILGGLAAGGYTGYKIMSAGSAVFKGNIFEVFNNQPLKQDANGRSNFLLLGTSEDDNGHEGANLTDSMMVISIDQTKKNIYMFSVPRDLYVKYGMACPAGYYGKINSYFSCVNSDETAEAEQERLTATQNFVGEIFGLDIQYGIHVNHTVIKESVDAVGGVDVDVQGSNGASGILDRNFDWRCNYKCYLVKYDNGVHHLDGEHALFLSMARGDVAPTYGLANSNFDREKNQQKIIMALRDKALSTGTLTNLSAITKLIDAMGNNLRTNIQANEIRTLMQVAGETKAADIYTIDLFSNGEAVVTTGNYNGASVVMPSAGIYSYGPIRAAIQKNLNSDPVIKEAAPIVVLNGTGQSGYAKTKSDALQDLGFTIALVDNAPDDIYEKVEIYYVGNASPKTAAKLETIYGVKVKVTDPPIAISDDVQFVIIFGQAE